MFFDNEFGKLMIKKLLSNEFHIYEEDILGIYAYGSMLYGCNNDQSDYDFVVVLEDGSFDNRSYQEYKSKDLDIQIWEISDFQDLLNKHDITAMECYFQKQPILKCEELIFELDKTKLRKSVCSVVNNSWVKAKKKYQIPTEDNWVGWKSLFHSFRIADFGLQIAKDGYISNYGSMNPLKTRFYIEFKRNTNLVELMERFKQEHNEIMSEFRQFAPKR